MKWLTNTHDPNDPHAPMYVVRTLDETYEGAWRNHCEYLSDKIIGRPQATSKYAVEQLEEMGMVGVYAREDDANAAP